MALGSKYYKDLETQAGKHRKYDTIGTFVVGNWYIPLLIALIPSISEFLFGGELGYLDTTVFSFAAFICLLPWLLIGFMLLRRGRKYALADNEWAVFYTHSIVGNLDSYRSTKNDDLKKDYRKMATKNAKDFLACVEKNWKIGSFKLSQDLFRKPLSELKKNIQYRVIPALKDGDEETLGKVEQIMRNFLAESRHLKLETIDTMNDQMSSRLGSRESFKMGIHSRISTFLESHMVIKHSVFVITLLLACCVFYYVALSYLQISRDYAFAGAVAVFLALITMYFARRP